jgi:hypothetical protein
VRRVYNASLILSSGKQPERSVCAFVLPISARANVSLQKMLSARATSFRYPGIGSAVCLLLMLSALTVLGQSGRRGSKSPPVAVPTPEAPAPEKKPVARDQPRLNLTLGTDRVNSFSGIPTYYYDSVLESCAKRLGDSSAVRLEVVPEMMRTDAIKRAKGEKEGFVAWLELRSDGGSPTSGTSLDNIYIEYTVFEPVTGKIASTGHAYQSMYRKGLPIPGTSGRNSTMITESRLRDAAEEAAEKILKALHLALPPGNTRP